ncbi:hypothetical protein SZ25_00460 [Candidatus Arcanobacter lacustris]|jgi:predicted membrane protein|uniref:Uncharacterized protein n=1 Tax=Candidatus Arcanibacter lacustris TaxID=1607817 RepID=A0A0F5MNQ1_9RICK|nr:hypothetical protein SZ25_00460 [Candidatus Arcanobacter lacustris]
MQSSNPEQVVKKLNQISSFLFNLTFIWGIGFFVIGTLFNIFSSNEALVNQLFDLISNAVVIIAAFFFTKIAIILYCFFYCLITKDWSLFKNIEFSNNRDFDHLRSSREWDQKSRDDFHRQRTDFAYSYLPTNIHYRNN